MTSEPKVIISPKTALMMAALIKQECENTALAHHARITQGTVTSCVLLRS